MALPIAEVHNGIPRGPNRTHPGSASRQWMHDASKAAAVYKLRKKSENKILGVTNPDPLLMWEPISVGPPKQKGEPL